MAKHLEPGTVCLIKGAGRCNAHDGKVVVVTRFDLEYDGYECLPQLLDPKDGYQLIWIRESLKPLNGGDGMDEMLRIAGSPLEAECTKD
jgi:hypothetical protein